MPSQYDPKFQAHVARQEFKRERRAIAYIEHLARQAAKREVHNRRLRMREGISGWTEEEEGLNVSEDYNYDIVVIQPGSADGLGKIVSPARQQAILQKQEAKAAKVQMKQEAKAAKVQAKYEAQAAKVAAKQQKVLVAQATKIAKQEAKTQIAQVKAAAKQAAIQQKAQKVADRVIMKMAKKGLFPQDTAQVAADNLAQQQYDAQVQQLALQQQQQLALQQQYPYGVQAGADYWSQFGVQPSPYGYGQPQYAYAQPQYAYAQPQYAQQGYIPPQMPQEYSEMPQVAQQQPVMMMYPQQEQQQVVEIPPEAPPFSWGQAEEAPSEEPVATEAPRVFNWGQGRRAVIIERAAPTGGELEEGVMPIGPYGETMQEEGQTIQVIDGEVSENEPVPDDTYVGPDQLPPRFDWGDVRSAKFKRTAMRPVFPNDENAPVLGLGEERAMEAEAEGRGRRHRFLPINMRNAGVPPDYTIVDESDSDRDVYDRMRFPAFEQLAEIGVRVNVPESPIAGGGFLSGLAGLLGLGETAPSPQSFLEQTQNAMAVVADVTTEFNRAKALDSQLYAANPVKATELRAKYLTPLATSIPKILANPLTSTAEYGKAKDQLKAYQTEAQAALTPGAPAPSGTMAKVYGAAKYVVPAVAVGALVYFLFLRKK